MTTPVREDLENQAKLELFSKMATEAGIDLTKLSSDQIAELFEETFNEKIAGDEEEESEEDKKKKEEEAKKTEEVKEEEKAAAAEFAALQTKQAEVAWADHLGRTMAHSFLETVNGAGAAGTKTASAAAAPVAPTVPAGTSYIDRLALTKAAELVQGHGLNAEEAFQRVLAVATLGLTQEGSKVAAAANVNEAVEVRALEYLEAAGYKVNWGTAA